MAMFRASCFVLLLLACTLGAPGLAVAHDRPWSLLSASEPSGRPSPAGWSFFEPCDDARPAAISDTPGTCGRPTLSDPTPPEDGRAEPPPANFRLTTPPGLVGHGAPPKQPDHLLGSALAAASLGVAAGISFPGSSPEGFHFANEGWFGRNTYAGGADKTAHFVFSSMLSRELALLYARLGYSETQSRWLGFGVSALSGLVVEVGDGTTEFGFSYEDLLMDVLGAGAAALIATAGVDDLVGFRWGFIVPPDKSTCCQVQGLGGDYSNYLYTADLKLAGVGRRLGIDIGPLKYLLLSVVYGTKGYPSGSPDDRQRRVGFEVGLNLGEILSDLGARRTTWWGYLLQAVGENVRFPYTAGGFRYDLNNGRWYGPTTR